MLAEDFVNLKTNQILHVVKSIWNHVPESTVHRLLIASLRIPNKFKLFQ